MSVADVARIWQEAGVSVIPVLDNGTKRPAVRWGEFQATAADLTQVSEWWGNGREYGLALICGKVSGNLELLELEGSATTAEQLTEIVNQCDELGVGHIWDLLIGPDGFSEHSPSGGLHLLYRLQDSEVPGNTKIAGRGQGRDYHVLAETRGEGGYVITAPTSGLCHPSGEPWTLTNGTYGQLPMISRQERDLLHEAIRLALDESPDPPPSMTSVPSVAGAEITVRTPSSSVTVGGVRDPGTGLSPGDAFEEDTDWVGILAPHGWRVTHRGPGNERHWVRPGKDARDGSSATTGRANDRDRLYVFSTSTEFQSEVPYTKFGAYALLNFNGDHHAAAQALVRLGYGSRLTSVTVDEVTRPQPELGSVRNYTFDDVGNGMRFAEYIRGRYRWIFDEKRWFKYDGTRWVPDNDGGILLEFAQMTEKVMAQAQREDNPALLKWARNSRNLARTNAGITFAKSFDLSYSSSEWGPNRSQFNMANATVDLETGQAHDHKPEDLLVHMAGTEYEPEATCPKFEEFMEAAVPDPATRSYVQRALGYSLLGDADQRAMFVLFGPSGTGKSTLIETMHHVLGSYATTAQAGTFRATKNDKAPTNDLHELRGRRFVTTSETAEGTNFDEDLLKRLTGRDHVRSRALYQESSEWIPECTLWLATNNPPRFNSDDNAIWSRVKLIPLTTVFLGDGQVFDYARRVLAPEAAGIFNWLLEGLRQFQANGLGEPEMVVSLTQEHRISTNSVARFVADKLSDGSYVEGPGFVKQTDIYLGYVDWCRTTGERPLGSRRFVNHMESSLPKYTRVKNDSGTWIFNGIYRTGLQWLAQVS